MSSRAHRLRWRDYRTRNGGRPLKTFFDELSDEEAATVAVAMKEVAVEGLAQARHLRGDVYEVRAFSRTRDFRVLFAQETKFILLGLSAMVKKTAKTPQAELELAEKRLADWRKRRRALAPKR